MPETERILRRLGHRLICGNGFARKCSDDAANNGADRTDETSKNRTRRGSRYRL
jgi:hypothetical protein